MKISKGFIVGLTFLALCLISTSYAAAHDFGKRINFLDNVKRVDWYKVEGNNIVIGWKGLPDKFITLNHSAAIRASESSLYYNVTVWSVQHRQKNWNPGQGGHICVTTAKYGRIRQSNCKK